MIEEAFKYWVQHLPFEAWIFGICIALLFVAIKWDQCRHARTILEASAQLRRLKKIDQASFRMAHLRKVDPFVFEEMLLTAFKKRGYKIRRNKRYTGDGGIDGHVRIKGQWHAIQAKRYKNHIKLQDVKELSEVCRQRRLKGLSIHTGKTGAASRVAAQNCQRIQMISGSKLLKLLEV